MGIFGDIGNAFGDAAHWVGGAAKSVANNPLVGTIASATPMGMAFNAGKSMLNGQGVGGALSGALGSTPIGRMMGAAGMLGGGQQQGAQGGTGLPTYGPGAWPGWPVPQGPAGTPQQHFNGDLSNPGQGEQYYGQNQGFYGAKPNAQSYWDTVGQGSNQAGQYWNSVAGRANTAPPKTTNYAQNAYQNANASTPADTSSYYDNAIRRSNEDVARQYGATGSFGSTRSMDAASEASTNLRAQQAKDDASYQLQRQGLLGQLAGSADTSSARGVQSDLGWLTGLGNLAIGTQNADLQKRLGLGQLAIGTDAADLARMSAGMDAATNAQQLLAGRGQNFFNNNLALGNQQANLMQGIYGNSLQNDNQLLQAQLDLMLGGNREALNQVSQGRAASEEGIGNLFGLMGNFMGGAGGAMGGI